MIWSTPFNFTCSKCKQPTTINSDDVVITNVETYRKGNFQNLNYKVSLLRCPNMSCRELHSFAELTETIEITPARGGGQFYIPAKHKEQTKSWLIFPDTQRVELPNYIPNDISRDIGEASTIMNKSPRASASLLRRALQSILRDFWKQKIIPQKEITKEIEQLKDVLDASLYQSLHSLKNLAKFATHPEANIDTIIETTEDECQNMLKVICICIKEWYINKHDRDEALKTINNTATKKINKSKQQ